MNERGARFLDESSPIPDKIREVDFIGQPKNQKIAGERAMQVSDYPEIDRLPLNDKMLLVEALWGQIVETADQLPIPDSHLAELERRRERMHGKPEEMLSLDQFQMALKRKR